MTATSQRVHSDQKSTRVRTTFVLGMMLGMFTLTASSARAQERASISGTILEDVGPLEVIKLIADARVYLQVPDDIILLPQGSDPEAKAAPIAPYRTIDSTRSDRLGRFAFADKPTGSYRLRFVKDGFYVKLVYLSLSKDTVLTVNLVPEDATCTLTGIVREGCPEGTVCLHTPPLPGCTVSVTIMYPALMKSSALPEAQCTAVTDADGRYIINDIPISGMEYASYSASASKEGFKPRLKGFSPEVGGTSVVDFVLTPLSTPVAPAATVRPGRNALQAGADNRSVIVDLARPTALTVSVFSLDGRAEGAAVRTRMLGAGRHEIALNAETDNARNTRIVRVTGDSFSRSAILSHTSERR